MVTQKDTLYITLTVFTFTPQNGHTALWEASIAGHLKIVEVLTNAGAAVDIQDEVCFLNTNFNCVLRCTYINCFFERL